MDEAKKDIDSLAARLIRVEELFMQLKMPSGIRWNAQTTEKLLYLTSAVETADFPPAQQHLEVYQVLKKRLQESQTKAQQLFQTELPAFIERMKKYNLNSPIVLKTN